MKSPLTFFLLLFPLYFNAQYLEAGLSVGTSNYQGDLAPTTLWTSLGETKFAQGVFVRLNMNDFFGLRLDFSHGVIAASDNLSQDEVFRKNRNLSFRSDLYELAFLGEFNILGFQPVGKEKIFSPYLFGGIALFQFNPQTEFEGQWYDLQPLGTEGQGLPGNKEKYALRQFSIPIGLGIKIAMSQQFTIGFEVGTRKTFTDYLDDVSTVYTDLDILAATNGNLAAELSWRYDELNADAIPPEIGAGRGNPKDLDWYIFSKVTLSYNFISGNAFFKNGKKSTRRGSVKCPTF